MAASRKMSPDINANSEPAPTEPTPVLSCGHHTHIERGRAKTVWQEERDRERKQLIPFNLRKLHSYILHVFSPFIPLLLLLQNGQTDRFIFFKLNGYIHCFFLRGSAGESTSPNPVSALRKQTALLPCNCVRGLNSAQLKSPPTEPTTLRAWGSYKKHNPPR